MKAGDYVGIIKCENIKYETTVSFTLHEEGYRKEYGEATPVVGDEFSRNPVVTSAVTSTPRPQSTPTNPVTLVPTQTPEQATGFGPIMSIISIMLAFCVIQYTKRR